MRKKGEKKRRNDSEKRKWEKESEKRKRVKKAR